jgi:hypothetical protein
LLVGVLSAYMSMSMSMSKVHGWGCRAIRYKYL